MCLCRDEDTAKRLTEWVFFSQGLRCGRTQFQLPYNSVVLGTSCLEGLSPLSQTWHRFPTQVRFLLLYCDDLSQVVSRKITYLHFILVKSPYPQILGFTCKLNNSQTAGYIWIVWTYTILGPTLMNYVVLIKYISRTLTQVLFLEKIL